MVPRHVRELEPPILPQKLDQNLKEGNVCTKQTVRPTVWKRSKVVAVNSPSVSDPLKRQRQLSGQQVVLDSLSGSDRPRSAQSALASAWGARPNHNEKATNLNRKQILLQPVAKRASPRAAAKGGQILDAGVLRPHPLAAKVSASPLKQQKHQQQYQDQPSRFRIISAPVFASSLIDSAVIDDEVKENGKQKKVDVSARVTPERHVRRSSAPLVPLLEDRARHSAKQLGELRIGDRSKIPPTVTAGFAPVGVSMQSQQGQRQESPGRLYSPIVGLAQFASKSPVSFFSKEDLPCGVEDRRRFEQQQRQLVALTEFKPQLEERSGKINETPQPQTSKGGMEFGNNVVGNRSSRKRGTSTSRTTDEKEALHLVVGTAGSSCSLSDDRSRKGELPPPLTLAPLQIRSTQSFLPQSNSPSFGSPSSRSVVGRVASKQSLLRVPGGGGTPSQSTVGTMPAVHGVKVPPQSRGSTGAALGGGGGGGHSESGCSQGEAVDEPPLLVKIDYSVSALSSDNVTRQTVPVDLSSAVNLPSLTDAGVQAPDVVQRWRNVSETSGGYKITPRTQFAHCQASSALETQAIDGEDDVLAAFQKANNVRLTIPSTPEMIRTFREREPEDVLRQLGQRSKESSTFPKQKQSKKTNTGSSPVRSGAALTALHLPPSQATVGEQCVDDSLLHQSQMSLKTEDGQDNTALSSLESSWNDVVGKEERAALVALVDSALDARANDDSDHADASIISSDNQREHSLEGYLAMLDHLRGLLYSRSKPAKIVHSQTPPSTSSPVVVPHKQKKEQKRGQEPAEISKEPTTVSPKRDVVTSDLEDLPTPVGFNYTRANFEHHEDPHGQLVQAAEDDDVGRPLGYDLDLDVEDYDDSAEEELDEEASDDYDNEEDGDADFEDAFPLSPVRCATRNDTYRRLLKNADHLSKVLSTREAPAGDNACGGGAEVNDDKPKKVERSGAIDITENSASSKAAGTVNVEEETVKNGGTMDMFLPEFHAKILTEKKNEARA